MPCCCSCTVLTAILVNLRRQNEPVLVRTMLISSDALTCPRHLLITSVIALAGMAEDTCTCSDPEDHQQVMQLSLLHLLHMAVKYIYLSESGAAPYSDAPTALCGSVFGEHYGQTELHADCVHFSCCYPTASASAAVPRLYPLPLAAPWVCPLVITHMQYIV